MDIRAVAAIARAAGAPLDKAAGVHLLATMGRAVDRGQPVLRIHSSSRAGLENARDRLARSGPLCRFGDDNLLPATGPLAG
jgi:thymidine phosphorylase